MENLINDLIQTGYLQTDRIIQAFRKIDRVDFLPADLKHAAESNIPLPIGFGQTISQPLTVAFMLEKLDPNLGQIILDVGSGSGWTTALLAEIVGRQGRIIAVERIPELFEFGLKNVERYGFIREGRVEFFRADGTRGLARYAPYDRILVSAACQEVPTELKKQLSVGGKMVIPVINDIWLIMKESDSDFKVEKFPGFSFVPLVKDK